jgi:hypothetical protein
LAGWVLRPRCQKQAQAQAQAQGNNTHSRNTQTTANNIENTQGNQQTIAIITQGTSSTNDAYQRAIFWG